MLISQSFPGKYLKASDLQGREIKVTIAKVVEEEVRSEGGIEKKPIVYFRGTDMGLVLNITNANNLVDMYGDNTDAWIGKPIVLFMAQVEFRGKTVAGIRVKPVHLRQAVAPAPAQRTAPANTGDDDPFGISAEPHDSLDDEVPF